MIQIIVILEYDCPAAMRQERRRRRYRLDDRAAWSKRAAQYRQAAFLVNRPIQRANHLAIPHLSAGTVLAGSLPPAEPAAQTLVADPSLTPRSTAWTASRFGPIQPVLMCQLCLRTSVSDLSGLNIKPGDDDAVATD